MPILNDTQRLVDKEVEEEKLHKIIAEILRHQDALPTLPNLWVLEQQLKDPAQRKALLGPVFPDESSD
jgi:hypothetical protein